MNAASIFSPSKVATLKSKRKLSAVNRDNHEEHPRNNQLRDPDVPRVSEDYINQISEEIEDRVTKKLSQEFRRRNSLILGVLSKLDDFLLNSQVRVQSANAPDLRQGKPGVH